MEREFKIEFVDVDGSVYSSMTTTAIDYTQAIQAGKAAAKEFGYPEEDMLVEAV